MRAIPWLGDVKVFRVLYCDKARPDLERPCFCDLTFEVLFFLTY